MDVIHNLQTRLSLNDTIYLYHHTSGYTAGHSCTLGQRRFVQTKSKTSKQSLLTFTYTISILKHISKKKLSVSTCGVPRLQEAPHCTTSKQDQADDHHRDHAGDDICIYKHTLLVSHLSTSKRLHHIRKYN